MSYKANVNLGLLALVASAFFFDASVHATSMFFLGVVVMSIMHMIAYHLRKAKRAEGPEAASISIEECKRLVEERSAWRETAHEFFRLIEHIDECPTCYVKPCDEWNEQFVQTEALSNRLKQLHARGSRGEEQASWARSGSH